MLHRRLKHDHKNFSRFPTLIEPAHVHKHSDPAYSSSPLVSSLFPVVLRHRGDSSVVTVVFVCVYKTLFIISYITEERRGMSLVFCSVFFVKGPKYSHTSEIPLHVWGVTLQNQFGLQRGTEVRIQNDMRLSGPSTQHVSVRISMAGLIESGLLSQQI